MKLVSKACRMTRVKGIIQFYLSPTRLSTNGMSHPAFTLSRRAPAHIVGLGSMVTSVGDWGPLSSEPRPGIVAMSLLMLLLAWRRDESCFFYSWQVLRTWTFIKQVAESTSPCAMSTPPLNTNCPLISFATPAEWHKPVNMTSILLCWPRP